MFTQNIQIADIGIERGYLERYLRDCGYWANEERRERNKYVLSPSVYVASSRQEDELERLATSTYLAVNALNQKLCTLGGNTHLSKEDARFLKLSATASRSLLRPQDQVTRIPPVIKVDLVQDLDGSYKIAEVDTYNPRGFGFAAMLEGSITSSMKLRRFPGIEELVRIFKGVGVSDDRPWFVIVSEFERFYRPAYEVLSSALKRQGIHFPTLTARDAYSVLRAPTEEGVMQMRAGFLSIPDTLFAEGSEVRERFLSLYRDGHVKAVYPPVAYLGSKAFLPYLRSQAGMSEFIPPTSLIGKNYEEEDIRTSASRSELVLKATVSSGMKGVFFSDVDQVEFEQKLSEARTQRNASWILQEQVRQKPVPVVVFDDDGNRVTQNYYLRITAYVSVNGIVDAEVTGRIDRKVHGAPDCIQIPVVLS